MNNPHQDEILTEAPVLQRALTDSLQAVQCLHSVFSAVLTSVHPPSVADVHEAEPRTSSFTSATVDGAGPSADLIDSVFSLTDELTDKLDETKSAYARLLQYDDLLSHRIQDLEQNLIRVRNEQHLLASAIDTEIHDATSAALGGNDPLFGELNDDDDAVAAALRRLAQQRALSRQSYLDTLAWIEQQEVDLHLQRMRYTLHREEESC
mmetsp:Transcript_15927/g.47843  ORF Transcript_15927/g.47843 Transcript_15927/m.47843 type:complete len:208 (+) Transcript_15927:45-668(+)